VSKLTLSFKGNILRVIPVLEGDMLIGHDPSCTIHIDSLALEAQHARLHTSGPTSTIADLNTDAGTFVNQQKIAEHELQDGDVIRVGKHTLTFAFEEAAFAPVPHEPEPTAPTPPEPTPSQRQGWLQILTGANLGKTLNLNKPLTNLGKPGVATAVIARRNDGYFISHLEGKVAPRVGDESIADKTWKLEDGDIIQIGNIKMQFYLE
jgi:pSer/pThr/pTyr-binding forkhead associated (FHA) protein